MYKIGRHCLVTVAIVLVMLCMTSVALANSGANKLEEFVDRLTANLASSQEIEAFITSLSDSERESFGLLLASALQIPVQQWQDMLDESTQSTSTLFYSSSVLLGHDLHAHNLISSKRWYDNATKCDEDSDVDRLFVYGIKSSNSRNFRWTAPESGHLTAIMLLAYHAGGKPGVKGILTGAELHVCIGDTVVTIFSNETIWGHNFVGRHLKVREY